MANPTLVQHKQGGSIDNNTGVNAGQYFLPNPTLAGNCIILFMSWTDTDGTLSSIVDDGGNTWSTTADKFIVSSTNVRTSIFHLENCNANTKSITANFSALVGNFHMAATEVANIALSSALNGTVATADVAAPALACGSFTPTTNNDANGGNLIIAYYRCSLLNGNSTAADHYTPGGSFSLLGGDSIRSPTGTAFNQHACEYFVQATQAAINPSLTANSQSASDSYNCVAIALKAASAGTTYNSANGIHVKRILHYTTLFPATGTVKFVAPSQGNLRVIQVSQSNGVIKITSITDSDSNTYVSIPNTTANTWLFYAKNCTANNALTFTVTTSAGTANETSTRFFDIEFSDTVSPLGAHADNIITVGVNLRADDDPIITPTQTGSLIIACGPTNGGPIKNNFDPAATNPTPAAAIFDLINYTGETDNDTIDNADACAHYYAPNTNTIHWNWVTGVNGTTVAVVAAEFKTAPAAAQTEIFSPPFDLVKAAKNFSRDWIAYSGFLQAPATIGGFTPFERPFKPQNFAKDWIEFYQQTVIGPPNFLVEYTPFERPPKPINRAKDWIEFFQQTTIGPLSFLTTFTDFYQTPRPRNYAKDWIEFYQQTTVGVVTPANLSQFSNFDPAKVSKNFAVSDWITFNGAPKFTVTPTTWSFSPFDPAPHRLFYSLRGQQPQWWTYSFDFRPPPKKRDKHDSGDYIPRWHRRRTPPIYSEEYYAQLERLKYPHQPQPEESPPLVRPPNLLIPLSKLIKPVYLPSLRQAPPHRPVPSLTTNPPAFQMASPEEMTADDLMIIRMLMED